MLAALALGLSTLEGLFPLSLIVPLPGVKLGLANIVTVFALYQLGAGAAAHNIGQMAAACITLGSTMVLGYLPFLLAVSLVTGTLTGFVTALLMRATQHIQFR